MPFVHLRTDRPMNTQSRQDVHGAIISNLKTHLQKEPASIMVQLDDSCFLHMGEGAKGCVFVDIRVRGRVSAAAAEACCRGIIADMARLLEVSKPQVYLNLLEMDADAVGGSIF